MPLSANHPVGTLQQIADYIRSDYFTGAGESPRKWNLGDNGDYKKYGTISYIFSPNWFDTTALNGGDYTISKKQQQLFRTAFDVFKPLGINFVETLRFQR